MKKVSTRVAELPVMQTHAGNQPLHIAFRSCLMIGCLLIASGISMAQNTFNWPHENKVAISLSFDDARFSQVDTGMALLDKYGVKATFYVVPSAVRQRLDGWKKAVTNGHEIANHSLYHPCTGNFPWSRQHALEDYTLKRMKHELKAANDSIRFLLGVQPTNFAYPCGQTFVGRGSKTKSYVPLISKLFLTGRGWLDESANDPGFDNFAQLTGMEMDGKDFDQILALITEAKKTGQWLVLVGHEIGDRGQQTTRVSMLSRLLEYALNPENKIWLQPVNTVASYIKDQRK